jgi:hypothetical protein
LDGCVAREKILSIMKIIIPTCDKYRNILEANKFTLDKFGGENLDITVLGFKKPDFDMNSWKFISLGDDSGAQNFTNDLIPYFQDFNDEYFIYGNDDMVFTNEFNLKFLDEIIEAVKLIPNFGRMWLTQTPPLYYGGASAIKNFGQYHIAEINQWAEFRLSLQFSLWKTSYFKRYLIPNISPWQWETRDTAKYDGAVISLPINNFVVSAGHIMKEGQLLNNWHNSIYGDGSLNDEDIKIIDSILKEHNIL